MTTCREIMMNEPSALCLDPRLVLKSSEKTLLLYGCGGDFTAVGSRIVCNSKLKSTLS